MTVRVGPASPALAGVCSLSIRPAPASALSCHAPAVADDDPAQFDLRELRGTAAKGVHCDYCHKIAGVGDGKIGLTHGRYNLRLLRPAHGQVFFGPLDDATRGNDAFAPLYRDSKYCALCHEGVVFGVHVYSTYSEWQRSPAYKEGRQCQDCHMAPTGRMTNIAPGNGGLDSRSEDVKQSPVFRWKSRGNVSPMSTGVGVMQPDGRQRSCCGSTVDGGGGGHRVPTGFIDKHLILVVEGEDAAGKRVALRSGPTLSSIVGKQLAGRPGKLYAKLLRDFDGRSPVPFWRADPDPVDTRLTPGRADVTEFIFERQLTKVHVRVLYRRFWMEVGRSKGWPDAAVTVLQRDVDVSHHD